MAIITKFIEALKKVKREKKSRTVLAEEEDSESYHFVAGWQLQSFSVSKM